MCHLRCYTKNHGENKIIDLVRFRQQKELGALPATGTDGLVENNVRNPTVSDFHRVDVMWLTVH